MDSMSKQTTTSRSIQGPFHPGVPVQGAARVKSSQAKPSQARSTQVTSSSRVKPKRTKARFRTSSHPTVLCNIGFTAYCSPTHQPRRLAALYCMYQPHPLPCAQPHLPTLPLPPPPPGRQHSRAEWQRLKGRPRPISSGRVCRLCHRRLSSVIVPLLLLALILWTCSTVLPISCPSTQVRKFGNGRLQASEDRVV